jgi:hypothetical protein
VTDSIKYLWMLLCEESSYIFMLMLIVGTAAVMSFFLQRLFVSWWGNHSDNVYCRRDNRSVCLLILSQHINKFKQ